MLNIGNRELFATLEGKKEPDSIYSGDLAGGDVIFLAFGGPFYLIQK